MTQSLWKFVLGVKYVQWILLLTKINTISRKTQSVLGLLQKCLTAQNVACVTQNMGPTTAHGFRLKRFWYEEILKYKKSWFLSTKDSLTMNFVSFCIIVNWHYNNEVRSCWAASSYSLNSILPELETCYNALVQCTGRKLLFFCIPKRQRLVRN